MPSNRTKGGFYAVRKGRNIGIYTTWADCEAQIKGFPDAKYQKFTTLLTAENFIANAAPSDTLPSPSTDVGSSRHVKGKGKRGIFGPEVEDVSGWDIVYSDGACKGNGKVGSVAGVGVWWGSNDPRNLAERCPGDQTNNRAELIAILRVLETTPVSKKPMIIRTDSQYSINCLRTWIHKWRQNDWHSAGGDPVKNAGIIRCISTYLDIRSKLGQKVVLEYVKGHSGDVGNDGADAMANQGALSPATPERDWEDLEQQLAKQFNEIIPLGAICEEIEVLGPEDGNRDDTSGGSTKESLQSLSTISETTSSKPLTEQPDKLQSISGVAKSPVTPTSSSARLYKKPYSPPKRSQPPAPRHISDNKSPLKVAYVTPPLIPVQVQEINFEDYADCVVDDSDLANDLSD